MDEEEKLIEAVRRFSCLWQVSSKAYKDQIAKRNAWKEVATQVEQSVEECQRKWKLLRDRFVRELRKVNEKKSGDPGPAYLSCWPYYGTLLFLQESVRHKKTHTNIPQPEEEETQVMVERGDNESSFGDGAPDPSSSLASTPTEDTEPAASTSSLDASTHSETAQPPSKRRKSSRSDDIEEAILRSLKDIEEARARQCQRKETDEDYFGKHVAAVLNRLPNRARAMVRLRIEQILIDTEFPEPDPTYTNCNV